jgi:transposase
MTVDVRGAVTNRGQTNRRNETERARTKGKTEAGVKYVKRNRLADFAFDRSADLETHLRTWLLGPDQRMQGTTRGGRAGRSRR